MESEHPKRMAQGGVADHDVCPNCGYQFDDGDEDNEKHDGPDDQMTKQLFASALRSKGEE